MNVYYMFDYSGLLSFLSSGTLSVFTIIDGKILI